jgi:cobalt-zinc-cadmium efflux system protein
MPAAHSHPPHHHGHAHAHAHPARGLLGAFALTLVFALFEAAGGLWSGSLALLGDAGHMFSDATALGLAGLAAWIARRPPSPRHSYGLARAEVLAALINGLVMLAVVTTIVVEAIARLQAPRAVPGLAVMVIAGAGLAVNIGVLALLSRGAADLNTRGALLHVFGDLLGSVAALIAGAVILFTGWTPIDSLLSLAICALILFSTLRLLREALHVLMEGVPRHLDLATVGRGLAGVPGVISVHDLHIWTPAAGGAALSAHVVVEDLGAWMQTLALQRELLKARYGIEHVTLQPETRESLVRIAPLTRLERTPRPRGRAGDTPGQ